MSQPAARHWGVVLPPGWRLGKIKHLASVTLGKMLQAGGESDVRYPYLRAANVQPNGVLALNDVKQMAFTAEELTHLTISRGDVVVVEGGQGGYGRAAYVGQDLTGWGFQNSITRLRPRDADGRYIAYYLLAARQRGYIQSICNIVSMPHYTTEKLAATPSPVPPVTDQRVIADYLDLETAQIDALITKQEQLIETLRERRSAVVTSAFSGAPSDRLQLRRLTRLLTSGSRDWSPYYADHGDRFLRIGNLPRTNLRLRGEVQFVDLAAATADTDRARLQENDLLFSITAYLGSVALVDPDWIGAYISQHVALCRLNVTLVEPSFLGWFMLTSEGRDQLKQNAAGGTKQQLSLPDLRELRVPTPSLDEQREIVVCIERQMTQIDALITKAEQFIALAQERRSALITAAVTGQIDVRAAS